MNKMIFALAFELVCFGCGEIEMKERHLATGNVVCYQAGIAIYDTTGVALVEIWNRGGIFVEDQLQYYVVESPYRYSTYDGFRYSIREYHIVHFSTTSGVHCRQL